MELQPVPPGSLISIIYLVMVIIRKGVDGKKIKQAHGNINIKRRERGGGGGGGGVKKPKKEVIKGRSELVDREVEERKDGWMERQDVRE